MGENGRTAPSPQDEGRNPQGERPSFEEELAQDVLEIITVFSARLYGARSHKARKTIEALTEAHKASQPQIEMELNDGTEGDEDSTQNE